MRFNLYMIAAAIAAIQVDDAQAIKINLLTDLATDQETETTSTPTPTDKTDEKDTTDAKAEEAIKKAVKKSKTLVTPKAHYMISVAAGTTVGLLGGYSVARPHYYRWNMNNNEDILMDLDVTAATEHAND